MARENPIADDTQIVELNHVLPLPEGAEWLPLTPRRGNFAGLDGRTYSVGAPEKLLDQQKAIGLDLPIDINHSTELKGPLGGDAPAAGWVTDYRVRDGILHGRIEWNERGREALSNRDYRYYSPVYNTHKKTRQVTWVKSIGLTNSPNLPALPALNHQINTGLGPEQGGDMKYPQELLTALSLGETATDAEVVAAIGKLKEAPEPNRQNPGGVDVVPRTDYELALNQAQAAKAALAEREKAEFTAELNSVLDKAQAEGKIAPASRGFYTETIRDKEGLTKFAEVVAAGPGVVEPNAQVPPGAPPEQEAEALSAAEKEVAEAMGYSPAEYRRIVKGEGEGK